MRIFAPFFIWLIAYSSGFGQDYSLDEIRTKMPKFESDTALLTPKIRTQFADAAARLALRILQNKLPIEKRKVEIDDSLQQSLFHALVAVKTSKHAALDSIFRIYEVKIFPDVEISNWVVLWEHNQALPDERVQEDIPALLKPISTEYGLVFSKTTYVDEQKLAIVLKSTKPIDIDFLAYLASEKYGIQSIKNILTPFADGNNISAKLGEMGWNITFSLRFGNCSYQCPKAYNWYFLVKHNGDVDYLGSEGDTIPPWMRPIKVRGKYDFLKLKTD